MLRTNGRQGLLAKASAPPRRPSVMREASPSTIEKTASAVADGSSSLFGLASRSLTAASTAVVGVETSIAGAARTGFARASTAVVDVESSIAGFTRSSIAAASHAVSDVESSIVGAARSGMAATSTAVMKVESSIVGLTHHSIAAASTAATQGGASLVKQSSAAVASTTEFTGRSVAAASNAVAEAGAPILEASTTSLAGLTRLTSGILPEWMVKADDDVAVRPTDPLTLSLLEDACKHQPKKDDKSLLTRAVADARVNLEEAEHAKVPKETYVAHAKTLREELSERERAIRAPTPVNEQVHEAVQERSNSRLEGITEDVSDSNTSEDSDESSEELQHVDFVVRLRTSAKFSLGLEFDTNSARVVHLASNSLVWIYNKARENEPKVEEGQTLLSFNNYSTDDSNLKTLLSVLRAQMRSLPVGTVVKLKFRKFYKPPGRRSIII